MIYLNNIGFFFFLVFMFFGCKDSTTTSDCNSDCDIIGACYCVQFTKVDGADQTLPENQDCITDEICLTRGNNKGLYNSALYSSDNEMIEAYQNGEEVLIKWGDGTIEDAINGEVTLYNGLTNEAGNIGSLTSLPDRQIIAYLVNYDVYLNFKFVSWSSGNSGGGGGFSYIRDIPVLN